MPCHRFSLTVDSIRMTELTYHHVSSGRAGFQALVCPRKDRSQRQDVVLSPVGLFEAEAIVKPTVVPMNFGASSDRKEICRQSRGKDIRARGIASMTMPSNTQNQAGVDCSAAPGQWVAW